jgi:hypothetical protein
MRAIFWVQILGGLVHSEASEVQSRKGMAERQQEEYGVSREPRNTKPIRGGAGQRERPVHCKALGVKVQATQKYGAGDCLH